MRSLRLIVLLVFTKANILDHFDVMSIAFTTTRIIADWNVAPWLMSLLGCAGLVSVELDSWRPASPANRFGAPVHSGLQKSAARVACDATS